MTQPDVKRARSPVQTPRSLFVQDSDAKIVDFKLNPVYEQFPMLQTEADVHDCEETCLTCDPGRIRGRIYDTPERLTWATATLLDRFYRQPSRDDIIRQRHAAGERTGDLARAYGLSAARVSQIVGKRSHR